MVLAETTNKHQWVELPNGLKEEFLSFNSYEDLNEYRAHIGDRFGDDKLKAYNERARANNLNEIDLPISERHSWAVFHESDSESRLFFYREVHPYKYNASEHLNYAELRQKHIGFKEWLNQFSPNDWNDLLMVWNCYFDHCSTGRILDWNLFGDESDSSINARLRQTRGLLLWSHQFLDLLKEAAKELFDLSYGINQTDCSRVMHAYRTKDKNPKSKQFLELLNVDGMPLAEILDKRWLIRSASANSIGRIDTGVDKKSMELAKFLWLNRVND